MTRGQFLVPLVCLLIMGGAVVFLKREPAAQEQPVVIPFEPIPAREPLPVINKVVAAKTDDPPENTSPVEEPAQPEPPPLPAAPPMPKPTPVRDPSVLKGTSWENPFDANQWTSTGWRFSSAGMETDGTDNSSATFIRPYRKLMLECDILASGSAGCKLELHLTTPDTATTKIVLQTDRVSVLKTEHGGTETVVEKSLATRLTSGSPHQFRMVATGNRIVISWDGRRLLATEQPTSQSGQEIVWSIHTAGAEFRIPRLRVEGD